MPNKWSPAIRAWPDGKPLPFWDDEADPRWLVAVFLVSEVGYSHYTSREIAKALEAGALDPAFTWQWSGNSQHVFIEASQCRLEACDDGVGVPEHIIPVAIPCAELLEVVRDWLTLVADFLR